MFRVYVYYLRGSRAKDFETQEAAMTYVQKILNKGKAVRVTIEDIDVCNIVFDKFSKK